MATGRTWRVFIRVKNCATKREHGHLPQSFRVSFVFGQLSKVNGIRTMIDFDCQSKEKAHARVDQRVPVDFI